MFLFILQRKNQITRLMSKFEIQCKYKVFKLSGARVMVVTSTAQVLFEYGIVFRIDSVFQGGCLRHHSWRFNQITSWRLVRTFEPVLVAGLRYLGHLKRWQVATRPPDQKNCSQTSQPVYLWCWRCYLLIFRDCFWYRDQVSKTFAAHSSGKSFQVMNSSLN